VNVTFNAATNSLTGSITTQTKSLTQLTASASQSTIGINVTGAEYSYMPFVSANDLDYLRSQGITLIRLPIAWERMQPTLNGPLDQQYLTGLETVLSNAAARGMQVIVDVHNYGRYNLSYAAEAAANNGIVSVNTAVPNATLPANLAVIGSPALPNSAFANFWGQLAGALQGRPGLAYYDLMNEPYNMGGSNVWPQAAQAAVNAIRAVDMNTKILVEGTQWSSAYWWPYDNGNLHVVDPANKLLYEAHLYFNNGQGGYSGTYAQMGAYPNIGVDNLQPFLNWLKANNAQGFIGEFGAPGNDPQWIPVMKNFMAALQANGISGTYWNYAYSDPSGKNSWWPVADPMSIFRSSTGQLRQGQSLIAALSSQISAGGTTASNPVTLAGIPTTSTINGVGFCTKCEFVRWGNVSSAGGTTSSANQNAMRSGWWVAGQVALNSELPTSGTATYAGSAVGDVANNLSGSGWQNYVASGDMNMNWNFASRSGNLSISGFDKSVTPAGLSFGGPMTAPGQLASSPNQFSGTLSGTGVAGALSGSANGSFVKGLSDPAANVMGNFNVANQRYIANGIFAGAK
jgi:endoglucanase